MRIVLTGGGTGGHFYPLIAVAEALREKVKEEKLLEPELYFFGPAVLDERALFEQGITFVKTPAGKVRRYFSLRNFTDFFKTLAGILITLIRLYQLYPDVIFSKGGYGAAPTLFAARLLKIPVVAHESDSVAGKGTLYAAPFARSIAISFDETYETIPERYRSRVAMIGNPIRRDIEHPATAGAHEFLDLEKSVPVLLVLGGSLGAEALNDAVLAALPDLVQRYQIIHQTGERQYTVVSETAAVVLEKNERRYRYKVFPYLSTLALKMAAGAADLVITRAGAGAIAEISSWGVASIVVPIPEEVSRDQRSNAFAYARRGAATVIEQANLKPNILVAEVDRLFTNPKARNDMAEAAKKFSKPGAARKIADELVAIALEHTA